MKKIFAILFICQLQVVNAQQNTAEITKHYRVLDSLTKKNSFAEIIQYARQVAPVFEKNNSFPSFHYFKLQVEYLSRAYAEIGQDSVAEELLVKLIPKIENTASRLSISYINAAMLYSTICLRTGQFTKAYEYALSVWKTFSFWKKFMPGNYVKLSSGLITMCSNMGKYEEAIARADEFEATIASTRYDSADLVNYYLVLTGLYSQMGSLQKMALYTQKIDPLLSNAFIDPETKAQVKNMQVALLMMAGNKDSAEKIIIKVMNDLDTHKMQNTEAYHLSLNNFAQLLFYKKNLPKADSLLTSFFAGRGIARNNFTWTLYFTMSFIKDAEGDYQAALLYADTALSVQPEIAWSNQQVSLPIIDIQRSQILLKLKRSKEAETVYEKAISDYMQYIKKNISYLSEPDKDNLLFNYYHVANFAPSFIANAEQGSLKPTIKRSWTRALFFRGVAMGEESRVYKALRKASDSSSFVKIFNEIREIKLSIDFNKKNPQVRDTLALKLEKKVLKLQQYLPVEIIEDTIDMVTKLYQSLQPGEAIIDFTGFTKISNTQDNPKYFGAYILRYDNPNPLFQTLCAEETLKKIYGKGKQDALYPSAKLAYNSKDPGYALYKMLWQPLKKSLGGIRTVYIVPDGLLHKIAFHALSVSKGIYVSDSIDIRYLYHAGSICKENFRKTTRPSNVQVWAGINYNKTNQPVKKQGSSAKKRQKKVPVELIEYDEKKWSPLPGGLRDAKSLEQLCLKLNLSYKLHTDSNATETACKKYIQDSSDLLSIITHGKFDTNYFKKVSAFSVYINMPFSLTQNPMQQVGLIMAGRNQLIGKAANNDLKEEDRILLASEIAALNLENKKLVVLSSCGSGLGEIISAEGVYGMNRAFKLAGAERVLISLWDVVDNYNDKMMHTFYELLLKGESAAIALKTAQQKMRKNFPPNYWAGFVLIE